MALWNEYLSGWFDGNMHAVGGNAAVGFPSATLRFQQSAQPQPLAGETPALPGPGVGISVIWVRPSHPKIYWEWIRDLSGGGSSRQQIAYAPCHFIFFVRAAGPAGPTGNAKALASQTGDLLYGVLNNSSASRPLGEKGIHKLRPETPVLVSGDASYELRLVNCGVVLRYPIRSQT